MFEGLEARRKRVFPIHRNVLGGTLAILRRLGWILNLEKSSLAPSQGRKFLGIILGSSIQKGFLPLEKVQNIQHSVRDVSSSPSLSIREGMSLLGLMTAAMPAVPWAQIHCRPLQVQILNNWDNSDTGLDKRLRLTTGTLSSLNWWSDVDHLTVGSPWGKSPEKTLTTDATPLVWGGSHRWKSFSGVLGQRHEGRVLKLQRAFCSSRSNKSSSGTVEKFSRKSVFRQLYYCSLHKQARRDKKCNCWH